MSCSRRSWILASNRLYSEEGQEVPDTGPSPTSPLPPHSHSPSSPSEAKTEESVLWNSTAHKRQSFKPGTFWFILSDDCNSLTRILKGNGSLFVACITKVNAIDLGREERLHCWK